MGLRRGKMVSRFNLKKEWEKTKNQLNKFNKEAVHLAHLGQRELIRFSQKGKLHIDATAHSLKMEQLYYLVGKEYVKCKDPSIPSAQLKKMVGEIKTLAKEQKAIEMELKKIEKSKERL